MKPVKTIQPVRLAKRKFPRNAPKKQEGHSIVEALEGRIAPATLYVDNFADLAAHITTDNGLAGLTVGDVVTWDPGAGSAHGAAVPGLIYGTDVFSSIQSGINAAAVHDVLRIAGGTFTEFLNVNKEVTLLGNQFGVHPVIGTSQTETLGSRGPETVLNNNFYAITPQADNITVDGFKFTGAGGRLIDDGGASANHFHLTNSIFIDGSVASTQGVIQIAAGTHNDLLIDFNLFQDRGDSTIYLGGTADRLHITNNLFNVEGDSVFYVGSTALVDAVISENEFNGTIGGVPGTGFAELNIGKGGNISIARNFFHDQLYTSMQVGIVGGSITDNVFSHIYSYGAGPLAGDALQLWGGQFGTSVSQNVVISGNVINYNDIPGATLATHGIRLRAPEVGLGIDASTIHITGNKFVNGGARGDAQAIRNQGNAATTIDASGNWWGTMNTTTILSTIGGTADITPLLESGTDLSPAQGFQGDFSKLTVMLAGAQTGSAGRVQEGTNVVSAGGTVHVLAGTYIEDVTIGKTLTLVGAGVGTTTISGAIGGTGATVQIAASNVDLSGFTITRQGNNVADWNDANGALNVAGVAIQGQSITGAVIHDNIITGNRNGIDVNNSNGHTIRNNVIDGNRTGMIFRNQTDNLTIVENAITNNFTVGVLFLDGSGGTNSPVQSAANSTISNNNISGNWYGGIVDRQTGGALPAPGASPKNFSGNWFGTATPVVTTANSTEPGYAAQIPVIFGGTATAPGGQPDIAGPASVNFDISPLLEVGTDTNVETVPGRGTFGFQGSHANLTVTSVGAQTGLAGRVQEGTNLVDVGGTVHVLAGTYIEDVTIGKTLTLVGAGAATTTISGAIGGTGSTVQIAASNVDLSGFTITRQGNNVADWNDANGVLNSVGVGIQGQSITGSVIHDNIISGNRNGIDINNSNGHTVRNNVIDGNRTGMILRNQTDNLTIVENAITNNFTVGVLFLDGSGAGVPVQSALNATISNNNISGNWYGGIVDRQTGGALPAPGTTNLKDVSGNWFGTATPVITTANTTEPGYAAQIPVIFGGTDTAPGGQPDIAGPASANFDITPLLASGSDTNVEAIPGHGTFGFQGDHTNLVVTAQGAQTGPAGRIQEGITLLTSGGVLAIRAGSYTGNVSTAGKAVTLSPGASPGQVTINGDLLLDNNDALIMEVNGTNPLTQFDNFIVNGLVTLGGATLTTSGTNGSAPGQSVTLIDNDGTDPVSGTFAGLPEGATVTINSVNYAITYAGGTGNDVVLTQSEGEVFLSGGNLMISDFNGGTTDDRLTITLNGANVHIHDPFNALFAGTGANQIDAFTVEVPLVSITGNIQFHTFGGNDIVTVDLGTGNPIPAGGLTYDGGAGGNDALRIVSPGSASYRPDATVTGTGDILAGASNIHFSNLEPVDFVLGGAFTLTLPGANDLVDIANGTTILGGLDALKISGSSGGVAFESANVRGASSILIDTTTVSGTDTITITSANNGHGNGALTIGAGAEAGDVITVNGTTTFTGLTTLNAKTINLNANITNAVTGSVATLVHVTAPGQVQDGVDVAASGALLQVAAGTYIEDVTINKTLTLVGAGAATTTISGAIGGSGATVQIAASNVDLSGFTITREGNNTTDWMNPGLNSIGVAIQGQSITGAVIHDNIISGNRNGIDINNSNGHTVRNNVIDGNRTGMIFRNQTDNLTVVENAITNNFTLGIVFLDGSGGTNSPVQSAANSTFTNNNISGNWWGGIVDRQTGGSLPAPGTNLKDFSGNYFGTSNPVFTTANTTEPGYSAAQIPVVFGGTATAPGGQPDIAGPASANFDVTPLLEFGTDTNIETTPGRGTFGFQGDHSKLKVVLAGAQVGAVERIQEGINLIANGALTGVNRELHVAAGTYALGTAISVNKQLKLLGEQAGVDARTRGAVPETIVDATGLAGFPSTAFAVQPGISGATIDGFTIQGAHGGQGLGGIYLATGSNGTTIQNNIIQNNNAGVFLANNSAVNQTVIKQNLFRDNNAAGASSGTGIYADNSTAGSNLQNVLIQDNNFTNTAFTLNSWGVGISNVGATPFKTITVTGNSFTNSGRGLYLYNTDGVSITGNTFTGATRYGVGLFGSNGTPANINTTISGNTFTNNGAGIELASDSVAQAYAGTLTLNTNIFNGAGTSIYNDSNAAVDARNNTFNGVLAATATTAQQYVIVNSIVDGVDVAGAGLVRTKTGEVFVTTNSFNNTTFFATPSTTPDIQRGVNVATAGDTVNVQAGTYLNNVTVNKALTLLGANAGNAGAGARVAETIVQTNGNQNAIFTLTSSGVRIDGFLLEGNDPSVTGVTLQSGDDANAAYGVRANGSYSNVTVQNNIIQHVSIGFRGDGLATGNTITKNWFDSIGAYDFGYAVSLRGNYYADVTNNKMTRVWTGVHTNNFNGAGGPGSWTVSGNDIHSYAGGILYWLNYNGATGQTISNNTITAETGAVANNFGILVVSQQDAVAATFTNNTITGTDYGVGVFSAPTTSPVTLGATNSIAGTKVAGVLVTNNLNFNPIGTTNFLAGGPGLATTVNLTGLSITGSLGAGVRVDASGGTAQTVIINGGAISGTGTIGLDLQGSLATASVTNTPITGFGTGIKVTGGTLTLGGGVTVTGGTTGLALSGASTVVTGNTLGNLSFTGQSGSYIALSNGALAGQTLNGTGATFDGLTGATATLAQNYTIENKILHGVDDGSLGFVRVKAGNVFVTPASFNGPATTTPSIQRGVNVAVGGDTVNVQAGTYLDNVTVNKALTLLGANAGNAGAGARVAETIVQTNGNQNAIFTLTSSGVKIDGFLLEGNDPSVTGVALQSGDDANAAYGVRANGSYSNVTVQNNIIQHVSIGFRGDGLATGNTITKNWFDSIGAYDFGYAVSLRGNYYADVTNNKMTRVWTGVHTNNFNGAGGPGSWTVSGNDIHSYAGGILYWLNYNGATGQTISNNTITAETGAVANNFGILVVSEQDAVSATFTNNTITGTDYGVGVFSAPTTSPVTLGATNSIAGTKVAGVLVTNNLNFNPIGTTNFLAGGPGLATTVNLTGLSITGSLGAGVRVDASGGTAQTVIISGATITGASGSIGLDVQTSFATASVTNTAISGFGTGINVNGGTLTLGGGVTVTGGTTGLALSGATAAVTGNTLGNLNFTGQSGSYIALSNGALAGQTLNGTGATFDGLTGATATLPQNYTIENKILHGVDDGSLGFVRVKAGNVFVTPASFNAPATTTPNIQRGVNVASVTDVIHVATGTYFGAVNVNKTVTVDLTGAVTIDSLAGVGSALVQLNANTLTVGDAASTTYAGVINGTGSLVKQGAGTLTLSGANTFSGATNITAGTLALQNTYGSTSHVISSGAVLELNVASGTRDYSTSTTYSGTGTLRKTGGGVAIWGASGAATFALGSGALIDVQAGDFVGANSANEVWTSNLSDLNVASGAFFDGVEGNIRVDELTGAGTIRSGYPGAGYVNFTFGVDNGSAVFNGALGDGTSAGNFVKTGTGTVTLTGASTYTGTTTVASGKLLVNGSLANTSVAVNSGATLGGSGTISGPVSVASGGTIAPGNSPGIISTGSLTLTSGSTFSAEVNGATAGTQYDQVNVTGTVNLGNATLASVGTITSTPGQQITLINNDGTDAVTGTFNGLPEGSLVTINGVNFLLTYAGGTGNDVVLVDSATTEVQLSGGNLTVTDALGGNTDDNLTLTKSGTNVLISDPGNNLYAGPGTTQVDIHTVSVPLASITGSFTFNTLAGNDTLTVDFTGGTPLTASGLTYNAGNPTTGPGDKLVVTGGTTTTVTHNFTNAHDGSVVLAGALAGTINYTGLEPITDNLSATDRVFNFNGGAESISLVDSGGADNKSTIGSTLGESVTFTNPTNSISIDGGSGDDLINITSLDTGFSGTFTVSGGAANDNITFGTLPTLFALTSTSETLGALPSLNIGLGGLNLTTTAGGISNTAAANINVTGTTTLDAGANSIALGTNGATDTLNLTKLHFSGSTVNIFADSGLTLLGINTGTGAVSVSAGSDLVVSTISAPGQTVTLTADNNNDNFGAVFKDGLGGTNVIADTLMVAGKQRVGASPDAGPYAVHLATQVNNLSATGLLNTITGAGQVVIDNTGALNVTNVATNSSANGAIAITATGQITIGTATQTNGGGSVSFSTTTGNILVGSVTALGDSVDLHTNVGAIVDNNGAATNVNAGSLHAFATTGIGAGNPLETSLGGFSADNVTGNVEIENTGALNINGGGVQITGGSGSVLINSNGSLTVSSSVSAPLVQLTVPDDAVAGNNLAVNAAVTSTVSTVTLRAGDNFSSNGSGTINAATSVTIAAAFGDVDNAGSATIGGVITAAGDVTVTSRDNIALGANITSTGGNASLTTTAANFTHTAGTISANDLLLSAATGTIGGSGVEVLTSVNTLNTVSANDQFIIEANGLTAINLNGNAGSIHLALTAGAIVDTDAATDAVGANLTISAPAGLGTAVNPLATNVNTITSTTTNTAQFFTETSGLIALNMNAGTGAITLVLSAGTLTDGDAATDVTAGNFTVTAPGGIATVGNPLQTSVDSLTTTSTNANQFITEANGLTQLNINAGTASVTLTLSAGSLTDADVATDIAANAFTVTAPAGIGSLANPLNTNVGTLTTTSTNTDQFILENNGLTALALNAGTGNINLALTAGNVADFDGTTDVTANTFTFNSPGGLGNLGNSIQTVVSNLSGTVGTVGVFVANTGPLTITGLSATTSGNILLTNVGTIATTGAISTTSGTITMSTSNVAAASPFTVGANMTATGDILLTVGEFSDAPTWADDFTLNGGATIKSTAGNITLRAGDDIHLAPGTTVNGFGTVSLIAGYLDTDGQGSLDLGGTIISGGALTLSATGDIIVGFLNAPGQTVTLTADSDNNGTGGIYRDGVAATNVIASTLIASASQRIFNATDPGTFGIHLVTQVSNLTATATVSNVATDSASILIDNTGALTVTSASTNSGIAGSININTTGALTIGTVTQSNKGGAVSLTTTGSGLLLGTVNASGDTVTLNAGTGAITDNNGASVNITASTTNLFATTGIGAGNSLELVSAPFTPGNPALLRATNTTGNIEIDNTGALATTGTGVTISGASGSAIITTHSPLTINAPVSAPIVILTAGETATPSVDNLTINATVTSTSGSVTLQAGDDVIVNAAVTSATSLTATAAFGDLDNQGTITINAAGSLTANGGTATLTANTGINVNGPVLATGNVSLLSVGDIQVNGNITSSGADVSLRVTAATNSDIHHVQGSAGVISGNTVTLISDSNNGRIGGIVAGQFDQLLTSATNLVYALTSPTSSGAINIIESNGATITGSSGTGAVSLVTNTGDWTVVAPGITSKGAVSITATAGSILDTGAVGNTILDITADSLTLTANTGIGQSGGGYLDVEVNTLTNATSPTGGVRLDLQDADNLGVNVIAASTPSTGDVAFTGSIGTATRHFGTISAPNGNIVVSAIAGGDLDITGNQNAGNFIFYAGSPTSDITRTVAGVTLTAPQVALQAAGPDGDIGTAANPILTNTAALIFVGTGTGDVFITEANGATVTGSTGSGNITIISTTGNWLTNTLTTTGNVFQTATAGAILDNNAASVNVTAGGYVATASTGVGTSADPIETTIANLEAQTATGGVFINETDALTIGGVSATNGVSVTTSGDIVINSAALTLAEDVSTANHVTLNSTGSITETTGAVKLASLLTTHSFGGQALGGANTVVTFDADNFTSGNILLNNATANLTIVKIANLVGNATVTNSNNVVLGDGSNQNVNVSGIASITATAGSITDGNAGNNNITALAAILAAGNGIATAANTLETNISNLEATAGNGGIFITEFDALTIGGVSAVNGVSATGGNIEIDSAALLITEQVSTPATVDFDATGSVTESGTGAVSAALLDIHSAGGESLLGANTVGQFTAVNTGAGTGISLSNNFAGFNISTVTNQTGGDVTIINIGNAATITGVITSGSPALGGDIFVQSAGLLTVNANVNSLGGSGGTLTLGGLLLLNASPTVGFGDVTLQGGDGPLTINAPISVTSPLVLRSTKDVNILAKVETTSLLADITVLADMDSDGTGGVYIGDNIYIGQLKAGRNLDVRGSEYQGSFVPALGLLGDSVIIQPNGATPRLEAVGNIFVKNNNAAPVDAKIWLGGLVRSNGSGDVSFDSSILVTNDAARVLTHAGGDIIFFGNIDSAAGAGAPFDLHAATDVGIVLFNGAVGSTAPLGDVTVDTAFDVTVASSFKAGSFSVGDALGTVELGGPVTLTNTGLNLSINAVTLTVDAPLNTTATGAGLGDSLIQVNNLSINATVAGDGVLTIQPRDLGRSIGVNATGDLNLNSTEIGLLQNGFSQIVIGRANGTSLITVGSRTTPDSWLDPVVFRSTGAGGQINLTGQLLGTSDASFTFLAPITTVNVVGTPTITTTGGGDVTFGSFTQGTALTLISDLTVNTSAVAGGDVLFVGPINGNHNLVVNAGTASVNLNGSLTPVGSGTSIGGTVALASVDITGGLLTLRPNIQTTGDQHYAGTSLQVYSGSFSALTTGSISFSGPMTINNSLGVFTKGGDITFGGTVNNVADPATVAGKGSLLLNAATGNIVFNGAVGGIFALKSFEVGGAGSFTLNSVFASQGSLKVKADEINLLGGGGSVHITGAVEFHAATAATQIEIGGAETATPNSLSLSSTDIAALADGASSILISQVVGNQPITVVGAVTFHDPATIATSTKGGGDVTVNGLITGDTADGGVTLKGPNVFLNTNITTTGGGAIDISGGVLKTNVTLNTSVGGGDVTLRDKFVAFAGGENLTIKAGAGDINLLSRLSDRGTGALLGDISLASTGSTTIKLGGYARSLFIDGTDGGGTTFLGGRVQTSGAAGQTYGDAVTLISGVTLASTNATGAIHFQKTVDSEANKKRSLSILNRAALSTSGTVVTFDAAADVGSLLAAGASKLGTLNIQTRGDVAVAGTVASVALGLRAGQFTLDDVTADKTIFLQGDGVFSGSLATEKLTVRSQQNINNLGAVWTATTSANLYSRFGSITATGANAFGTLILNGLDATIEEAGNMSFGAVRVRGTLDVTTTAGGNLTQLVNQRVVAAKLQGDIAGSITLANLKNDIIQIGDAVAGLSAGTGIQIWDAHPRAAKLEGTISTTTGDLVLIANPNGAFGYFTVSAGTQLQTPGGRWVVYSYYNAVTSAASDLDATLNPDVAVPNQGHPYGALPAGQNVLVYVKSTAP